MEIEKLSDRYTVRVLGEKDVEAVCTLCGENPLFYRYCPPFVTPEGIRADMQALPPQKTYADKFYIGFFQGDTLAAVMDLILRYPNAHTAFIGFFMMKKDRQGKGEGSALVNRAFAYLKTQGFSHVRLGFAKGNPQSQAFWTKNGFSKTGAEYAQEGYTVVVMERSL